MSVIKDLKAVLQELNSEYGQDHPLRVHEKTLNRDGFHFEFENIFGIAVYKTEYKEYKFILIEEDDDFWFVPNSDPTRTPSVLKADVAWLSSLRKAIARAENYIKLMRAIDAQYGDIKIC